MPVSPSKIENSTESWNDADWSLFNIICKIVKEDQKAVQETARECKRLFKQKNSPANPKDPNYGLANKERRRNRGLFLLHGIRNQDRKNMN